MRLLTSGHTEMKLPRESGGKLNKGGVLDNVKIFANAKTDFSDRFVEDAGMEEPEAEVVRLIVTEDNKTGIGTNQLAETLHVDGTARFEKEITHIPPGGDVSMGTFTQEGSGQ